MTTEEAVAIVKAWRENDSELRIPMNDWGWSLAKAIDQLIIEGENFG